MPSAKSMLSSSSGISNINSMSGGRSIGNNGSSINSSSNSSSSSSSSTRTAIPNFGKTSPFYIKASVAAAHIFSTCMVLVPNSSSSSFSIFWAVAFSSLGGSVPNSTRQGSSNTHDAKPNNHHPHPPPHIKDAFPSPSSPSSADLWWTKAFHATSLHHIMFATGTAMFTYLPLILCGIAVLAALIPGISAYTRYREDVVAIVLPTMLYMSVCAHLCELSILYVMPTGVQGRVIASAFVLHAGMHGMLQCTKSYLKLASRIRQSTSHTVLFLPLCYLGMFAVYFLALGMPAVSWEVARSPQDILVMHALVAFMPEVVGTLFVIVLRGLRSALDNCFAE